MSSSKVIRRYCSICKHTTAHDPETLTCTKDHSKIVERDPRRDTRTRKSKKQAGTTKKAKPKRRVVLPCSTCGRNTYHDPFSLKCLHLHKSDIQVAIDKVLPKEGNKSKTKPKTPLPEHKPEVKKVLREPFEHKFHYITWNSKARGYQLKLKRNTVELQPFYLHIKDALAARTKYFKTNEHRALGIRLRKATFNESVREKVRIEPSGKIAIEYQFNRYLIDDRKYSPVTRRDKQKIRAIFEEHARQYNAVVDIYNRLREERFMDEIELEELEMKPYVDLYFDKYAWEQAVELYRAQTMQQVTN